MFATSNKFDKLESFKNGFGYEILWEASKRTWQEISSDFESEILAKLNERFSSALLFLSSSDSY